MRSDAAPANAISPARMPGHTLSVQRPYIPHFEKAAVGKVLKLMFW